MLLCPLNLWPRVRALVVATCGRGRLLRLRQRKQLHRFRGHYEGDPDVYRSRATHESMAATGDPIRIARERLLERGEADAAALDQILSEATAEMAALLEAVRAAPAPDPAKALTDVFASAMP